MPILGDVAPSSGVLGDWYANLLNIGAARLVLCQSERSLLPVILPARNDSFPAAFGFGLAAVLRRLGIRANLIDREVKTAEEVVFSRARSRQVLGAMNDFAFHAQVYLQAASTADRILAVCLELAEMPSKPIGYQSPGRLTVSLFEGGRSRHPEAQ